MKRKQICEVTKAFEHVEVRIEITSQRPIDGVGTEIVKDSCKRVAAELAKSIAGSRILSNSAPTNKETMFTSPQP